ncbi:MAG: hypothetical protein ACK40K_09310, partial [Raineya sp.]
MYYAVRAAKVSGNQTFLVDRTTFSNNLVSVWSSGVNNCVITRNTINLSYPDISTYGIMVSSATGFTVEENTINKVSTTQQVFGVRIIGSGANNNLIYKNTFNNVDVSCYSEGINSGYVGFMDWRGLV